MIPDLALMLAAYMIARLYRSVIGPRQEPKLDPTGKPFESFYTPVVVDLVAVAIIGFCAWHVYSLGADVSATLKVVPPSFSPINR